MKKPASKLLPVVFFLAVLACPDDVRATFIEQLAIDTRAISMANTVTARPPGHMSIHYNPAGISQFEEGAWWHQGVTIYEPFEWMGFGMVYQSEIEADMHGSFSIEYSEDLQRVVHWYSQGPWGTRRTAAMLDMPTQPTSKQSGRFTTELAFPRRMQFGVRLSPLSRLHLMFDLKWSEWSARERDELHYWSGREQKPDFHRLL